MKVLVVEDPAMQQSSLSVDLQMSGYTVDVVNDSDRAIEFAANRNYEVIILDLMLPRESSLLVLHEIRESNRDVKILLLSEHDQVHDRVTALIQGANDFLVKPVSFEELHARIQNLLRSKISQIPVNETSGLDRDASDHTNQLIEELIDYSTCDHGPIELVISEIKATALLARVCTELNNSVNNTGIRIKLPTGNLPTLLTDDRLLQLLLVKLLSCVIVLSLVGSETEIDLSFDSEFCAITIVTLLAHPMTSDELESIFGEYRQDAPETFGGQSLTNLSLVKNFAQRLNLNLKASLMQKDRICIELSGIKVI